MLDALETQLIRRTHRVPAPAGSPGDSAPVARQLDIALMQVGFKATPALLGAIGALEPGAAMDTAARTVTAVRELVGSHRQHNVYFKDFPNGVPDTVAFWAQCVIDALYHNETAAGADSGLSLHTLSLVDLPTYGTYQHSYADMLAAHRELIPHAQDRVTVLHLGDPLDDEAVRLYHELAGSTIPLNPEDRTLLADLALYCLGSEQPKTIPIRENRAHINRVRLAQRTLPLIDTVTDVLRLAEVHSGGDGTLAQHTRSRSLAQAERRALLISLDRVIKASPAKLGDIARHRARWKRLARALHPFQHRTRYPHAMQAFQVAHGQRTITSHDSKFAAAMNAGHHARAVDTLRDAPGRLFRNLDYLLRTTPDQADRVFAAAENALYAVSGRVLLQLREHFTNRATPDHARIFTNRAGRAWVTDDTRGPLRDTIISAFTELLDAEITRRLDVGDRRIVVDPHVLDIALPLSDKTKSDGLGILPRGSVTRLDPGGTLSFFTYWRQKQRRTDYDLSVALLNRDFTAADHLSWTRLTVAGGVHSGDITDARDGATECIELRLDKINARHVVPQLHIFSGEDFDEVDEVFFGFMQRRPEQFGQPFEPRTVRAKSTIRGSGRVALPVMFSRDHNDTWSAKWTHLNLRGQNQWGHTVEKHRNTTTTLARAITERTYFTVGNLVDLLWRKANGIDQHEPDQTYDTPVTYIGLERPANLPPGSVAYTLDNLHQLVPA